MKKGQFNGYILEEVLAHLMRTSGYRLIDSAPPPNPKEVIPPDLCIKGNGLNLRGRGAYHQIDVLGEFSWTPAFIFPLRLITEAKFYSHNKVDIDIIRSQVGILADINQNYFSISEDFKTRYNYSSVIFSASGFTKDAIDMAYAHQIPLIDLNNPIYDWIKYGIHNFSNNIFRGQSQISAEEAKKWRTLLRRYFKYLYVNNTSDYSLLEYLDKNTEGVYYKFSHKLTNDDEFSDSITALVAQNKNKLFLGTSSGGLALIFYTETPEEFIHFSKQSPSHAIVIKWQGDGKIWTIEPSRKLNQDEFYALKFSLPERLHELIFKISEDRKQAALNAKEQIFSVISIYYRDDQENMDYVFNLKFDLSNLERRTLD